MTVFVPNFIDDDLSAAETWGALRFVNRRYIFPDDLGSQGELPHFFLEHMRDAVAEFVPEDDYLLIAGDHLQLVALSAMLAHAYQRFRVLRYSKPAQGYLRAWVDTSLLSTRTSRASLPPP